MKMGGVSPTERSSLLFSVLATSATPLVTPIVSTPLISLKDVAITYEGAELPVLSGINLDIFRGEAVLFLGPSGCGKSTLAMLCAGLIPRAVEGQVTGQVWRHAELERPGGIGYVFQDPDTQFCMLQVDDELAFGLENLCIPSLDMGARMDAALTAVGLSTFKRARHEHFSGGMKQKLAIATALTMSPGMLVLDEPTANLDPRSTQQVFQQIVRLRRQGQTLLVIEHKFEALVPWMDRVVLFNRGGQVVFSGPIRETLTAHWHWLVEQGVVSPWQNPPSPVTSDAQIHPLAVSRTSSETQQGWTFPGGNTRGTGSQKTASSVSQVPAVCATKGERTAFALWDGELYYGVQRVWTGVSFNIPEGSFTAIVGPNGSGKSSLLQVLAGLQRLTSGTVEAYGKALKDWKAKERTQLLSFSFQNPEYQFIYERVGDELANRMVGDKVPAEISQLLAEFGLEKTTQQSPFALSQGQKRRLSVAAMLRDSHRAYLLDEPTFGQDAHTQQVIMEKMERLHEAGSTIVMTTHDMDLVRRFATHVLVLVPGKLRFVGSSQELFTQPEIMQEAHLLADQAVAEEDSDRGSCDSVADEQQQVSSDQWGVVDTQVRRGWTHSLNPPWHLLFTLGAIGVALVAHSLAQALAVFLLPVVLMLAAARLEPLQVVKRLSPFLAFYILYVWSMTAYAKVSPGTPVIHILWMHLSFPGFILGLILALRMLATVSFGLLLISSTDITNLVVGLSQNFHVPPKFAYGTLAGIRFAPLFQSEWVKLRQARQLRGKDARWRAMRPITYALPLLTQAVRMSERVARAMEARGFFGPPADLPQGRTYYRSVRVHWWDFAYGIGLMAVVATLLLVIH